MHRLHGIVGGGGEDTAVVLVADPVKEACHIKNGFLWERELISPLVGVPLIEGRRRDQAPMGGKAPLEQWGSFSAASQHRSSAKNPSISFR